MQGILLSLALLGAATTALSAQTPTTPANPTDTTRRADATASAPMPRIVADTGDRAIFLTLDAANTTEIEEAQVALTKASSPRVKAFAQTLVDDHTAVRQAARDLARTSLGEIPSVPPDTTSNAHTAAMQQWANLTGKDFDRAFLEHQVDMHKEVIGDVREQLIPSARSKALKALLQKALPTLESHRRTAEGLSKEQ